MKLYFAAPLFSESERNFNAKLAQKIEALGYEVFLPQRDGIIEDSPLQKNQDISDKNRKIFLMDRDRIFKTDIFLFVLDGRVPDEGASVALGMAYTYKFLKEKNIHIIGLHSDMRASFLDSRLNPMLSSPMDKVLDSQEELLDYLERIE